MCLADRSDRPDGPGRGRRCRLIPETKTPTGQPPKDFERPPGCKTMTPRRVSILQRDNCQYCKADLLGDVGLLLHASIDHLKPRSKGGSDHPDNLVASCFACDQLKGDFAADSIEDARAYVAMKRAACLGYFLHVLERHGIDVDERHAGVNGSTSLQATLAEALGHLAHLSSRLLNTLATVNFDVETALFRIDTLASNATAVSKSQPRDLVEEPTPKRLERSWAHDN